jgi:hypothetical protein
MLPWTGGANSMNCFTVAEVPAVDIMRLDFLHSMIGSSLSSIEPKITCL